MLLSIEKRDFLLDLVDITNKLGTPNDNISLLGYNGNGVIYEDKLLKIVSVKNHTYLVVTRKYNDNQIIMLENDVAIRFHGEYIYLKEHVDKLIKQIKGNTDENIE